jgi:hypothetical protein
LVSYAAVEDDGHHYDKFEIQDTKTGQNVAVFFNTDAFLPAKSRVGDK